MDVIHNNNYIYNKNIKINKQKFGRSLSPNNIIKQNNNSDFVSLINNLNLHIKLFYYSTKLFLEQGKTPNIKRNISPEHIFDLIDKNLNQFIFKAKDIFQRLKYFQKMNMIQQKNKNKYFNQINPSTDNMNKSYILNKKKFFDDEIYIPSYCDNISNNNTNVSTKNNFYFQKNNSDNEIYNDNNNIITSCNNSYRNKNINKKYNYFYNINKNRDSASNSPNSNIYKKINGQNNNLIKNSDSKNLISLKKHISFDKMQNNSSKNLFSNSQELNINTNINNSNNIIKNNKFINYPEVFGNFKVIVYLLKELNNFNDNIFIKSIDSEKHKRIINNIYDELIKIIKMIYKNTYTNILNINEISLKCKENNTDCYNKDTKFGDLIYQKSNPKKNENLIVLKKDYKELQKDKEKMILKNNELIKKIYILEKELKNISKRNKEPILIIHNFYLQYLVEENFISEKEQKISEKLNSEIKEKIIIIEKLNEELNTYKEKDIKVKEELSKLNEEIKIKKEEIDSLNKKLETINKKNDEYINENIILNKKLELENKNIEKYKTIISYQEEEIKNLKNKVDNKAIKFEEISDKLNKENKLNINNDSINIDEKKNKKRNNSKNNEYQIEHDKIYLKYELLKNDYDKLNYTLQQKQRLLDNYSKISNETASRTNIDEQILELMAKHKKEIEELTKKYNKNIINLKMNQPNPYSAQTHEILIDKRYAKYDLKWYLLTIISEEEKNYENTFWVSEIEIKPILEQFNKFKTEREIEDEKFNNLYKMQEKWIRKIDENEKMIELLKEKLELYENNTDTL
jgi:hypothetical protein